MKYVKRILALCNDHTRCDAVLTKSVEIAKRYEAGLTVMFVAEEALFALPLFRSDDILDKEKIRHEVSGKLEKLGVDNAAVFVYENDTVDRALLEAEREKDALIVTHFSEGITKKLVEKTTTPVLVLKADSHMYSNAVVAVDTIPDEQCLRYLRDVFSGVALTLFQDFQFVPVSTTVDPSLEPYDVGMDATLFAELMEARREAFETFCKEKGISGRFEVGDNGVAEDTLQFVQRTKADMLIAVAMDKDTMLGDAAADIVEESFVDVLICFKR